MVGEFHVPAAAAAAACVTVLADELDEVELLDEFAEGAVGRSRLLLFENWHPVSRMDAAIVTVNAQIFLIMSRLHFCMRAHSFEVRS